MAILSITLTNLTREVVTFVLPADLVPSMSKLKTVLRAPRPIAVDRGAPAQGARGRAPAPPPVLKAQPLDAPKRIPGSITLQPRGKPGDKSKDLPLTVRRAPDVQRALREGRVKLEEVAADETPIGGSDPDPGLTAPSKQPHGIRAKRGGK
jgi:hypothetical protein